MYKYIYKYIIDGGVANINYYNALITLCVFDSNSAKKGG
jgi:hypothetical protein